MTQEKRHFLASYFTPGSSKKCSGHNASSPSELSYLWVYSYQAYLFTSQSCASRWPAAILEQLHSINRDRFTLQAHALLVSQPCNLQVRIQADLMSGLEKDMKFDFTELGLQRPMLAHQSDDCS